MRLPIALLATLAVTLVLGACGEGPAGDNDEAPTTAGAAAPASETIKGVVPTVVGWETLRAGEDASVINELFYEATEYSFSGPKFVPTGLAKFVLTNKGQEPHHMQILQLIGKRYEQFLAYLKAAEEGPPPDWIVAAGGPGTVDPGGTSSVVMDLPEGAYAIVDFIPGPDGVPHAAQGMVQSLSITAAFSMSAPDPAEDLTVVLSDFAFGLSGPVTAGDRIIKIQNQGPQDHEMAVIQMNAGATAEQVLAAFAPGAQGPPPGRAIGGIQAIVPDRDAFVNLSFAPGNYLLVCFIPDGETGQPHFQLGMFEEISVQ